MYGQSASSLRHFIFCTVVVRRLWHYIFPASRVFRYLMCSRLTVEVVQKGAATATAAAAAAAAPAAAAEADDSPDERRRP